VRYTAELHREYWAWSETTVKAKVPKKDLVAALAKNRGLVGPELTEFESVVGFLFGMEANRPSADEPICFQLKHTGPKKPKRLLASDVEELGNFLTLLGKRPWDGLPKPEEIQLNKITPGKAPVPATRSLVTQLVGHAKKSGRNKPLQPFNRENLDDVYDAWLVPLRGDVVNPLYRKDLFFQLLSGAQRLFKVEPAAGKGAAAYLCIPCSGYTGEDQDQARLEDSLRHYHPWMRENPDALSHLQEVDLGKIEEEPDGLFVLMGYRLLPLELYTGTYRIQNPDNHVVSYIYKEAYFHSIAEAWVGFGAQQFGALVGVRPGGLLMTQEIAEDLHEDAGRHPWALQNALLARMCAGMILLDRAANRRAAILQNFAGSGVVASWYWFMTGHTRGELLAALRDERTEQALRLELMDTLLTAYKVHLRSSSFLTATGDPDARPPDSLTDPKGASGATKPN